MYGLFLFALSSTERKGKTIGPGSFIEVRKILPLLVEVSPHHPSFHVVAFSLPGYGFSEASKKKGFALDQYAEVCI